MNQFHRALPCIGNSNHRTMAPSASQQTGVTMVELLVALVISLLIATAAITALTMTQRGFRTVDAASQLRDNARFTSDLIQRLGVQTGFKDSWYAGRAANAAESNADAAPNIFGFNNATSSASDPLNSATTRTVGVVGYGSDILVLRNQLVRLNDSSGDADGSMIDCSGNNPSVSAAPSTRAERMSSILSVAISAGEPSLMCTWLSNSGTWQTQPIIQGVENFQVLYGTDGVTAGAAPPITYGLTADAPPPAALTIITPSPRTAADDAALVAWKSAWAAWAASINQVPGAYFRADQLTVAGDPKSTNANWRRVRSLRIGMILRGPPNSSQESVAQTLYPFGPAKSSASGSAGSALSSTNDPGTIFSAAADGRLRQIVTFIVHLRNDQGM